MTEERTYLRYVLRAFTNLRIRSRAIRWFLVGVAVTVLTTSADLYHLRYRRYDLITIYSRLALELISTPVRSCDAVPMRHVGMYVDETGAVRSFDAAFLYDRASSGRSRDSRARSYWRRVWG